MQQFIDDKCQSHNEPIIKRIEFCKICIQQQIVNHQKELNFIEEIHNDLSLNSKEIFDIDDYQKSYNNLIVKLGDRIKHLKENLNQKEIETQIQQNEANILDNKDSTKIVINYYKKIQCEHLMESSVKENNWCGCFEFNNDATKLFIGCGSLIQIYQFRDGKILKNIQTLCHKSSVYCLVYMRQLNLLISGGFQSIMVWQIDSNNQFEHLQTLQNHSNSIYSLIINKLEDLLISGGFDGKIIIWNRINQIWNHQQLIETNSEVYCLSLNESQNKLISCGKQNEIILIEQQTDKQWMVIQKIKVNEWGYRLSFINDYQFAYQPSTNNILEIFNYEKEQNSFIRIQQVQIQSCKSCCNLFPIQFIQSKNVLVVKHGQYINFVGKDMENNYFLLKTIEFGTHVLQGRLTDDGQYLITWDGNWINSKGGTNEIQLRKLQYQV